MSARIRLLAVLFVVASASMASLPIGVAQGPGKAATHPRVILIIRHGEKTGDPKDVHLSAAGKERAKHLHRLFEASPTRPDPLPKPDFLFATHDSDASHRPLETIKPLAQKLKLPIDQEYHNVLMSVTKKGKKVQGVVELRDAMFGNAKYAGKTVLIAWHHGTIPELAKELKAVGAPAKWEKESFDRVWKITYKKSGAVSFVNLPQRLMPGDAVK